MASPRFVAPAVIFSASFYPPTLGIGSIDAPHVVTQGALVAVSIIGALLALTTEAVRKAVVTPPLVFAFVLCLLMALTALQTSTPIDGVARGIWFASVALVVVWVVAVEQWDRALLVLATPIAVFILAGVLAYPIPAADVLFEGSSEFFNERLFPWPRFRGLGANHTVIGLSGAILCFMAFSSSTAWGPTATRLIFTSGIVGVGASHSRAAIGALALGVAVEIIRSRRELLLTLTTAMILSVGLWSLSGADLAVFDRSDEQAALGAETDFLTGRGEVWTEALRFGSNEPLTGHGVGTFAEHTARQAEAGIREWDPVHAHNVLLELLVDQGLLGLLNVLALFIALVVLRDHAPRGGLGFLVVVGSHSMVEGLLYGSPRTGWWIVVAVLAATTVSHQRLGNARSMDLSSTDHDHAPDGGSGCAQARFGSASQSR